tara:strand:+ start:63 stop:584 length:522 start_codon:yes stop_codon:yes gene_type:complete
MEEIWKDIKDYEGIYQVSNLGNVKSLGRVVLRKNDTKIKLKEKILKPGKSKSGYLIISLYKNKRGKSHIVHRLIINTFIPCLDKKEVNHIDGDKSNNKLDNLEWCDRSYNIKHAYDNNLKSNKGSEVSWAKLTDSDILDIRKSIDNNSILGEKYNVSKGHISKIRNIRVWKHI